MARVLDRLSRESGPATGIDIPLPMADVLEALGNRRRRELIRRLAAVDERDSEPELELGEVAEYIAALENGISPKKVTADQRKNVYVGLYQSHLPTLERLDVVTVDGQNIIRPATDIGAIADLLTVVEDACAEGDA